MLMLITFFEQNMNEIIISDSKVLLNVEIHVFLQKVVHGLRLQTGKKLIEGQ